MANFDRKIKFLTLNVQGLRNIKTRRSLFRSFKLGNFDIISLQETYLMESDIDLLNHEWNGTFHLSPATTKHSQGLLTLFNRSLPDECIELLYKKERIMTSMVTINSERILITNVYSPCDNIDNKISFLNHLNSHVSDLFDNEVFDYCNHIILGDFNTCLNNQLDIISGATHPKRMVQYFNEIVCQMNVNDIFRLKYPERKSYTWSKKINERTIARRLDYAFVTDDILPYILSVDIHNFGFSDHSGVIVEADFTTFKRGPSHYKLNIDILKDIEFVNLVKNDIKNLSNVYKNLNPILQWEMVKAQIRSLSIIYSKSKSNSINYKKHNLQKQLSNLESQFCLNPEKQEIADRINEIKKSLECHLLADTRGAQIRAGIKYRELGEKCSKFFLGLEKSRSAGNTIYRLNNEGRVLKDWDEILDFLRNYYEQIYKSPQSRYNIDDGRFNTFLNPNNVPKLKEEQKEEMEINLTEGEILAALKCTNNNSSPGLDGLPVEVYKVFWVDIKHLLVNCFNYCFESGCLSPSQSQALICLLHKGGDADRGNISSWRPISLLNSDYKILARLLAMRMYPFLDSLVDTNQCAFIKGRGIATMLRELYDIIEHEKERNTGSIILSIDYAKAFDTVSTKAIIRALKLYGFGDTYIRWVSILLRNRHCSIRNGGYISGDFIMERGVRQGCPISPILFILTSELFAASIRSDTTIRGIVICNSRRAIKIRQYADDTSLFLRDMFDYREILSKIKLFSQFAGMQLNANKSFALRLGGDDWTGTTRHGIMFVDRIKILGIVFSSKEDTALLNENIDSRICNMKKICALWARRYLTVIGKIIIIKTFLLSQIVHIIQSVGVSTEKIKEINRIFYHFIWQNKTTNKRAIDRVKRKVMCNAKANGGLDMINLECFQNSFLLSWAERLLEKDDAEWKVLAHKALRSVGGLSAFTSNIASSAFKGMKLITNTFWRRVLCTYLDSNVDNHAHELTPEAPLFTNKLIQFKKSVLFFPECINASVKLVKDVLHNDTLIGIDDFKNKVNLPNTILIYNCIYNALLPLVSRITNIHGNNEYLAIGQSLFFRDCEVGTIGRKQFYNLLNVNEDPAIENSWSQIYELQSFKPFWLVSFNSTKETRLQELQWKILMGIYPTGTLLYKMKLRQSELCEYCNTRDNIEHFFFSCLILRKLWETVSNTLNALFGKRFNISQETVILGWLYLEGLDKIELAKANEILLIAKMCVSKYKYKKTIPPHCLFENEIELRHLNA